MCFFNHTAPTDIYTLSLHDALPILQTDAIKPGTSYSMPRHAGTTYFLAELYRITREPRSEEHTSELQSRRDLVCRLLLEKKNTPRAPCSAPPAPPASPALAARGCHP